MSSQVLYLQDQSTIHLFIVLIFSLLSDGDQMNEAQSIFWTEWKAKLEQEKRFTEQTKALEQLMPGVDAARFLAGDADYIKSSIFALVDTVKLEKKHVLKEAIKLADMYGLHRTEVCLCFLSPLLFNCFESIFCILELWKS